LLRENETLALLEQSNTRSLLFRSRGLRESMLLSLATREASVRIEGARVIWEQREKEIEAWEQKRWVEVDGVRYHERDKLHSGESDTCESWIDVGGRKACSTQEFWSIVGFEQQEKKTPIKLPSSLPSSERPPLYPLDHVSPTGSNPHLPRVVLYGSPSSPTFQTLFTFLYQLSNPKAVPISSGKTSNAATAAFTTSKNLAAPHPPRLQFVLRFKPSTVKTPATGEVVEKPKLVLTGYGAELTIKKTDYLVIDDRLTAQSNDGGEAVEPTEPLLEIEGDIAPKMEPVKQSDIAGLSLRTAQFILNSKEPFKAFTSLTAAFPRLASHLPVLVPSPSEHLLAEASTNQMSSSLTLRPHFFLNGLPLAEADIDPYALLRLMRKERKYVSDIAQLHSGFTGKDARSILIDGSPKSKPAARNGVIDAEALGELYDATDRAEGGQVILWWNDLEKDRRYKSWSRSTRDVRLSLPPFVPR
jgi:UDP-glucose:glycoprotein glucosyltransferase